MELSKISKKELIKNFVWEIILIIGISIYFYRIYGKILIFDSCLLSGILFLSIGIFRIVRHLGLFDMTVFGFKKLGSVIYSDKRREQVSKQKYHEFLDEYSYDKSPWELIFPGLSALLPSFILLFFS